MSNNVNGFGLQNIFTKNHALNNIDNDATNHIFFYTPNIEVEDRLTVTETRTKLMARNTEEEGKTKARLENYRADSGISFLIGNIKK